MTPFAKSKILWFHGGAIAVGVGICSITTTYGEAHLQAPHKIDGRYAIVDTPLPGCLQNRTLTLQIQQSGTYLAGALLPADATDSLVQIAEERPNLTGHWDNQKLTLAGDINYIPDCNSTLAIAGTVTEKTLTGTLQLGIKPPIPFSAQWEATKTHQESHE